IGGLWHGAGWTFIIWGALHGIALAIHRFWQSLGFKMNKILAWFITFNFINITWVFFRAKDFESAIKVLGSMFSFDNVMLPNFLETKLQFLKSFGITFGGFITNIGGDYFTPLWFIFAFILVLAFKNSMEKRDNFKPSYLKLIYLLFVLSLSFYSMIAVKTEFLYFNF
ncbi:MBOAT family protein, partial [Aliarcobacter cryaerophilus]|nr:MBOAT family protein [Aliarcobacter cryaerophilus]